MKLEKNDPISYDMTKEEMEAEIQRYIKEKNKHIGEEWPLPIGKKWFGLKNELITQDLIRNYCNCVGDLNPLFRDKVYATGTRWGGIIAPPMIIHYIAMVSGGLGIEPPSVKERGDRPRVHGVGGLNVGGTIEFFKPIRPGDEFHCVDKFLGTDDVTKKERPVPRLIRNRGQRKFINQRDEIVAIAAGIELLMLPEEPLKKGEKRIKMGDAFPEEWGHYYTEDELAVIDKAMEDEEIRGDEPRYWEDVNEGDELKPVIKGPLTMTDIAAGMAFRGFLPAMEVRRMVDKSDDVYSNIDPRTGDMFGEYRCHVEDALAQMYGEPGAFATGTMFLEWACHLLTNWMGDDGFLKRLDTRHRRMMPTGDTCWVKGKVAKKYLEGKDHFVDVMIEGTNWGGNTIFTGKAIILLPSREQVHWIDFPDWRQI
ncbi:MAG: MaoC family dehydratase N-terminal domain-containing protein [bacterium]